MRGSRRVFWNWRDERRTWEGARGREGKGQGREANTIFYIISKSETVTKNQWEGKVCFLSEILEILRCNDNLY